MATAVSASRCRSASIPARMVLRNITSVLTAWLSSGSKLEAKLSIWARRRAVSSVSAASPRTVLSSSACMRAIPSDWVP